MRDLFELIEQLDKKSKTHQVKKVQDRVFLKHNYKSSNSEKIEPLRLTCNEIVVWGTTFNCVNKHEVIDLKAKFSIIDKNGNQSEACRYVGYCKKCDVYFMHESNYRDLCKMGTIKGRLVEVNYFMSKDFKRNPNEYANNVSDKGPLKQIGYSVAERDSLSAKTRQEILFTAIKEDYMTRSRIEMYLEYFITGHSNISGHEKAVEKWKEDLRYLRTVSTKQVSPLEPVIVKPKAIIKRNVIIGK